MTDNEKPEVPPSSETAERPPAQPDVPPDGAVAFEKALDVAGNGRYNILLGITCAFILLSVSVDLFGFSLVVTAACDLGLNLTQKSFVLSLPFVGILITSYAWGYISDVCGRRYTLVRALNTGCIISIISSFSYNWIVLAILKFVAVCFYSAANSSAYTLVGESCVARLRSRYALMMTCLAVLSPAVSSKPAMKKKLQIENQNSIRLDANSFISFMEHPSAVARIVQEHSQLTKISNNEDCKTRKTDKIASAFQLNPLKMFRRFGKTIKDSISSDVSKLLYMTHPIGDGMYEFWTKILKSKSRVIVELSANGSFSNQYWSFENDAEVKCNDIKIKTIEIVTMECCKKTTLQIRQDCEVTRELVHLQYTKWPSDNVSHSPNQIIRFISIVNDVTAEKNKKTDRDVPACGPIMVQSADGGDKSGVFCLLDMCINDFKNNKVLSVSKTLLKIKKIYGISISQPEDYLFCYNALYHFITKCKK